MLAAVLRPQGSIAEEVVIPLSFDPVRPTVLGRSNPALVHAVDMFVSRRQIEAFVEEDDKTVRLTTVGSNPIVVMRGEEDSKEETVAPKESTQVECGDRFFLTGTTKSTGKFLMHIERRDVDVKSASPAKKRPRTTVNNSDAPESKRSNRTSAAESTSSNREVWGKLVAVSGDGIETVDLDRVSMTIGRARECDILVTSPQVSSNHCRIYRAKGKAFVQDTSRNGTWVDGRSISKLPGKTARLSHGTEVMLTTKHGNRERVAFLLHINSEEDADDDDANEKDGPRSKYYIMEDLGKGAFACVRRCVHKETGKGYALKIIDKKKFAKNTKNKHAVDDEVKLMSMLDHPNVCGVVDMFDTPAHFYIVLELMSGGDLFDRIACSDAPVPESQARAMMKQILEGVAYLHSKGVVHRDLKPENILLRSNDSDELKITDFGISRVVGDNSFMNTLCGTPHYLAPEVLVDSGSHGSGYGKAVDVWSIGAIMFVMLAQKTIFEQKPGGPPIFQQIMKADIKYPDKISELARDLMEQMLMKDPSQRISLADALEHPWFHPELCGDASVDPDGDTDTSV